MILISKKKKFIKRNIKYRLKPKRFYNEILVIKKEENHKLFVFLLDTSLLLKNKTDFELIVKVPNNKQDCYKIDGDEFAHGGYECNKQTGTWSNECRAYYCDIGYYFDTYQKKCIKDACANNEGGEQSDKGGLKTWHIVLISIGSVLVVVVVVIIIWKFVISKKKNDINNIGPLIGKNDENIKELSEKN